MSTPPEPARPDPPEYLNGASRIVGGRYADTIPRATITWLVPGFVPLQTLSFVVGPPGCGKSCLGAWLCSVAKRPAILPGSEEHIEVDLCPRLAAANVPLGRCLILDERQWVLPADRGALTAALVAGRCDLLWIDPVDSYIGDADENDGQSVRAALESLVRVAHDANCAVVCARHPGKSAGNLCPGSRQWRAVPRLIWEMVVGSSDRDRRVLRPWKPYAGVSRLPKSYQLIGDGDAPRRFAMGVAVDGSELEVLSISDQVERSKVEEAINLLEHFLAESEQESAAVYLMGEKERIGERTLRVAARRLGVKIRREGSGKEHRSWWLLRHSGTPADPQTPPPAPQ